MNAPEIMPQVFVIAGPNGAGKSTTAPFFLPGTIPYLNADEIAKALPDEIGGNKDLRAGRVLLTRLEELARARVEFALETTLASRALAPRLRRLQANGYHVLLLFFYLPDPDTTVARVAERVRRGGHAIPEAMVRQRWAAGRANFRDLYRPLADEWCVVDNSGVAAPHLVAEGGKGVPTRVYDARIWREFDEGD